VVLYFEDIEVGTVTWSRTIVVDTAEMVAYARRYDPVPFHVDEEAARRSPFGRRTASGGYSISLFYGLLHSLHEDAQDRERAFLGGLDWHVRFPHPVYGGDSIRLKEMVVSKRLSSRPGRGVAVYLHEMLNQDDVLVLSIEGAVLFGTRPAAAQPG
jgi:acyl dehydratase